MQKGKQDIGNAFMSEPELSELIEFSEFYSFLDPINSVMTNKRIFY